MKKLILILMILVTLLIYGCGSNNPIVDDDFAKCLTENGAELYGSEWCPHCQEQKEQFGDSLKFIDYTECTENQQKCSEEEIQYLPTWKFNDGTSVSGVKSFDYLAEKTGCVLS
jgi:hypothetical protein